MFATLCHLHHSGSMSLTKPRRYPPVATSRAFSLATALLKGLAFGGVLAAAMMAPNALAAFKPFLEKEDWRSIREAERRRIQEAFKRLRERRLVAIEVRNGKEYLEITEQGKRMLRRFDFESLALPTMKRWNEKWRMVCFDIPEKKRRARHALQSKLTAIGFYPIQRSVFVYPYPCQDEIDYLVSFLELNPFVIYCETNSLGGSEGKVRRFFNLL